MHCIRHLVHLHIILCIDNTTLRGVSSLVAIRIIRLLMASFDMYFVLNFSNSISAETNESGSNERQPVEGKYPWVLVSVGEKNTIVSVLSV